MLRHSTVLQPSGFLWLGVTLLIAAPGARSAPLTPIVAHRGAPAFLVKDRPEPAMFLFEQEVLDKDAGEFRRAGFRLYSCIELNSFLDLGWVGPGQLDFTKLDKVLAGFAQRLPDCYLLPRVHLWAPQWWVEEHPSETMGYATGTSDGPLHESFASELWQEQAGECLRKLVRHILDGPWADRVMGIHVAGGEAGEWHPWRPTDLPDTSPAMQSAFEQYLREKYTGDIVALRKAWGDPQVTFDSRSIPTETERHTGDLGLFRDPSRSRKVVDYYECFHTATVQAIDHFCRIVKEESSGRLLTCVLYGYTPDMPYVPQEQHHRAPGRAHRLESVDMLAAPHSYWRRDLGQDGAFRTYLDSLLLHGKMFIDESDDRTHLADARVWGRFAQNLDQSLAVLQRAFINVVTHGVGMWYMDHSSGRWFDDPAMRKTFAEVKRWADHSMSLPRGRQCEVAVICCPESEFYVAGSTDLSAQYYVEQMGELSRAGAPFARYLIDDLVQGAVPAHKVYLFLDCWRLTPPQRRAVENLRGAGATLIWFYAPGFVTDEGLSCAAMGELTGITFSRQLGGGMIVQVDPDMFPDRHSTYGAWREGFGAVDEQRPRFVPSEQDAQVWGRFSDTREPALVVKDTGQWRVVYTPRPGLPWYVLNRLYHEAGVHVYCDTGDNLTASPAWVGLHTVSGGTKRIRLPQPCPVYDAFGHRLIADSTREFTVDLPEKTTALFLLGRPPSTASGRQ